MFKWYIFDFRIEVGGIYYFFYIFGLYIVNSFLNMCMEIGGYIMMIIVVMKFWINLFLSVGWFILGLFNLIVLVFLMVFLKVFKNVGILL